MILPRNPLPMRGMLRACYLLSYRAPESSIRAFVPEPLEPVTHGGFGFWNVVVCRVESIRPALVPRRLGVTYWHVAYRVHVRYAHAGGATEGLYFVRSDASHRLIVTAGRLLTDFNFHHARVNVRHSGSLTEIAVASRHAPAHFLIDHAAPATLTDGSPFRTLAHAETHLKYAPVGLSVRPNGAVHAVRIAREEHRWQARSVHVKHATSGLLDAQPTTLELCTAVAPIEYRWQRGEVLRAHGRHRTAGRRVPDVPVGAEVRP